MFAGYQIEAARRVVRVTFTGRLTFPDIQHYCKQLGHDPNFDSALAEIVDLTGIEKIELSSAQMMTLADELDPYSAESRRAFVVNSSQKAHAAVLHGLLRNTPAHVRVFASVLEAEAWALEDKPSES